MTITDVKNIITEKNIVVFAPHFDDVLFTLGGYIWELEKAGLKDTKSYHVNLLFSRSNYQAGTGEGNFDESDERIKFATGNRLIEDMNCNDELIGAFKYHYQLLGERECFTRGKAMADSEMEFPHGMYDDFDKKDDAIFARMKELVSYWAMQEDTALIFPMAIKEHIDHFITREAGIIIAKELGSDAKASFYFHEDKPYGGIATDEELQRMEDFIAVNKLQQILYAYEPEKVIELGFKHYISQVEDVYKEGINDRAKMLKDIHNASVSLDRVCKFVAP